MVHSKLMETARYVVGSAIDSAAMLGHVLCTGQSLEKVSED